MAKEISLNKAYIASEDVVARDIQGEFIIIPVVSGVADSEDEIFSLNETGRVIWERLDGKTPLKQIAKNLSDEYNSPAKEIESDLLGLMQELAKRKMVLEAK